jgi:hypothetical protein
MSIGSCEESIQQFIVVNVSNLRSVIKKEEGFKTLAIVFLARVSDSELFKDA